MSLSDKVTRFLVGKKLSHLKEILEAGRAELRRAGAWEPAVQWWSSHVGAPAGHGARVSH